jgi:hypothetical protein
MCVDLGFVGEKAVIAFPMKFILRKADGGHRFVGNIDPCRVRMGVPLTHHPQARVVCGCRNALKDDFATDPRIASPARASALGAVIATPPPDTRHLGPIPPTQYLKLRLVEDIQRAVKEAVLVANEMAEER